jgi:hypothetical protein
MRKQLLIVAAIATLAGGLTYGAEEPAVPPPPAAQAEPIPEPPLPPDPAVPTTPVPPSAPTYETPTAPGVTWPQDYGWYWYRPEAVVPGTNAGSHLRYPYYSYRRPWYPAGPASVNVTIIW